MDAGSTDSKLVSLLAMILALMLCNLGISAFVCAINRDIDLFVRETAKLFGHLGTPEYAHGACSFRIFLVCKAGVYRRRKGILRVCAEGYLRATNWKSLLLFKLHITQAQYEHT